MYKNRKGVRIVDREVGEGIKQVAPGCIASGRLLQKFGIQEGWGESGMDIPETPAGYR